jgi:hypothetical protein
MTLVNLDEEILRLNNYTSTLNDQIISLQKQKNDLAGSVRESVVKLSILVTKYINC